MVYNLTCLHKFNILTFGRMKVQLETFDPASKSPFRLLHDPKLSDLFYWHFHPEYELVYIEGASGTRHVGDHFSNYSDSDLVLIGSNIPHLNFDYGVTTPYRKEVLHLKPDFKETVLDRYPELQKLRTLLQTSQYGIAFHGETKRRIGEVMKQWHTMAPFSFFTSVLETLFQLSQSSEFEMLHRTPYINRFKQRDQERLRAIYAFLETRYGSKISLAEIAGQCHLGREAFCRYFKKETGTTFTTFLNQYRISQAKRSLLAGHTVTEACFACGFESLSYFNRTFKSVAGETPSHFKKRHRAKEGAPRTSAPT